MASITHVPLKNGIDLLLGPSDPVSLGVTVAPAMTPFFGGDGSLWVSDGTDWIPSNGGAPSWGSIVGKPTTRDDFGITDVYTQTESDALYVTKFGATMTGTLVVPRVDSALHNAAAASGAPGNIVFQAYVTGNAYARLAIDGSGQMLFGSGSAAPDTNLYRASAGQLRTDHDLYVAGHLFVATNTPDAYAFQVYQDSTTGYGITARVANDAYYAIGVNNAANTATTFYVGGDGRVVASNYLVATGGFIGAYNASYRRRLYAMGPSYAGTADTNGNLTDLTNYYGLTFVYDTTAGTYPNITGHNLGHGVELIQEGMHCGMWGGGGLYIPNQIYAGGVSTTGDISAAGDMYVQSVRVAKVIIADRDPTGTDDAPEGTLWFNKSA